MPVNTEAKFFFYISVEGQKRKIMMLVTTKRKLHSWLWTWCNRRSTFFEHHISYKRTSDFSSNKVMMKHKFLLSRVGLIVLQVERSMKLDGINAKRNNILRMVQCQTCNQLTFSV